VTPSVTALGDTNLSDATVEVHSSLVYCVKSTFVYSDGKFQAQSSRGVAYTVIALGASCRVI